MWRWKVTTGWFSLRQRLIVECCCRDKCPKSAIGGVNATIEWNAQKYSTAPKPLTMIAQLNGVFTAWTSLMDTALPLLWIFSSLFVVVANTHFDGMAHLRYQLTAFLSHYRLSLGTQRPIRTETETHILVIGSRSRYSDAFNGTQCDDFITVRTFSGLRSDKCDVNFNSRLSASNESRL